MKDLWRLIQDAMRRIEGLKSSSPISLICVGKTDLACAMWVQLNFRVRRRSNRKQPQGAAFRPLGTLLTLRRGCSLQPLRGPRRVAVIRQR